MPTELGEVLASLERGAEEESGPPFDQHDVVELRGGMFQCSNRIVIGEGDERELKNEGKEERRKYQTSSRIFSLG